MPPFLLCPPSGDVREGKHLGSARVRANKREREEEKKRENKREKRRRKEESGSATPSN